MMPKANIKPLNRKEAGKILDEIGSEYGCDASYMIERYYFFISEKNKVYIVNTQLNEIKLDEVRVNSIGLYFCELNKDKIRFSIEGSQILGKIATKNVFETDSATARLWLKGNDIDCSQEFNGFVIVKCENDFMGCGKFANRKLYNYIPKIRRITAAD
jgi:NOL1/NOP2/fmu family ribosome biogenesis protein